MIKHAPGPWHFHKNEKILYESVSSVETLTGADHYRKPYFAVVAADGAVICDNAQFYAQEVDPLNMPLIAVAPDLFDVVQGLVDLGNDDRFLAESWPELAKVLADAKLAVDKIRGES